MPHKTGLILALAAAGTLALGVPAGISTDFYGLPAAPPPEIYGNLLMNRNSQKKGMKPVAFSHWLHRIRYTCRVCHTELGFNMQLNTTEVVEADNNKGRFCGACHNGKISFSVREKCERCHNGDIRHAAEKYDDLSKLPLAGTSFGDGINWSESLKRGVIKPERFLREEPKEIPFDRRLLLEAEWNIIPPAVFPHKEHVAWVDCSTCHPDIFNIKKKTTKHFTMSLILKGQFCGVCHLSVAFPMNDCVRCHPGMKSGEEGRPR